MASDVNGSASPVVVVRQVAGAISNGATDPNTGTSPFESQAIEQYLQQTYGA